MAVKDPTILRREKAAFHVTVACLAAVVVWALANVVASYQFSRWRIGSNTAGLTDVTRQVLASMTRPMDVVVYYQPGAPLAPTVEALLREYAQAQPLLKVRRIDPEAMPAEAERVRQKYRLSGTKNVVVFAADDRVELVFESELSEYDFETFFKERGEEIERSAFKGEPLFSSAILTLLMPVTETVYFLTGHGEGDVTSTQAGVGYSQFASALRQNGVQTRSIGLGEGGAIPEDCDALIVIAPQSRYTPVELTMIYGYLAQGGRALVLLPPGPPTGLETVLARWGVIPSGRYAVDLSADLSGSFLDMAVTNFFGHEVTKPLMRSQLQLITPQPILPSPNLSAATNAPTVSTLFETSVNGRSVAAFVDGKPQFDATDPQGALPLAQAVEYVTPDTGAGQAALTRLIAVGDSVFLSNGAIDSLANRRFGELAVDWLLNRSLLIGSIPAQEIKEYRITLTRPQRMALRWALLLGAPSVPACIGLALWVRRRN